MKLSADDLELIQQLIREEISRISSQHYWVLIRYAANTPGVWSSFTKEQEKYKELSLRLNKLFESQYK